MKKVNSLFDHDDDDELNCNCLIDDWESGMTTSPRKEEKRKNE